MKLDEDHTPSQTGAQSRLARDMYGGTMKAIVATDQAAEAGASLPISGLTAWQGLFQHGRLQAGQASSHTAPPARSGRW
jgi:hypothetical protein